MKEFMIVFTDLDGSLLDARTYDWEPARPALDRLREKEVPLVFCSSKTRAEIESLREAMGNAHPYIVENGGAVFIPKGYFKAPVPDAVIAGSSEKIELGVPYVDLRGVLRTLSAQAGAAVEGYGDLSSQAVAELTGLSPDEAVRSKRRGYDEPFRFLDPGADPGPLLNLISEKGFRWTRGGRFYHLHGRHDKGRAIGILAGLYRQERGPLFLVGIGDGPNDFPMLEAVDLPILIRRPDGGYADAPELPGLRPTALAGPAGWNTAVLEILEGRLPHV